MSWLAHQFTNCPAFVWYDRIVFSDASPSATCKRKNAPSPQVDRPWSASYLWSSSRPSRCLPMQSVPACPCQSVTGLRSALRRYMRHIVRNRTVKAVEVILCLAFPAEMVRSRPAVTWIPVVSPGVHRPAQTIKAHVPGCLDVRYARCIQVDGDCLRQAVGVQDEELSQSLTQYVVLDLAIHLTQQADQADPYGVRFAHKNAAALVPQSVICGASLVRFSSGIVQSSGECSLAPAGRRQYDSSRQSKKSFARCESCYRWGVTAASAFFQVDVEFSLNLWYHS